MRTINIGTAAAPEDPYAQAQQQQAYADALTARAMGQPIAPLSSTGSAWAQGISEIGQALLASKLHDVARRSLAGANATEQNANQSMIDSLAPNTPGSSQPQNIHLDAVNPAPGPPQFTPPTAQQLGAPVGTGQGPTAPAPTDSPVDMTLNRETPQTLSPAHQALTSAIAGMDPRTANALLTQTLWNRANPAPQPSFKLGPNETQYDGQGNVIATGTPKPEAVKLERKTRILSNDMAQDYNFNPADGSETDVGAPYKHKEPPAATVMMTDPTVQQGIQSDAKLVASGRMPMPPSGGFGSSAMRNAEVRRQAMALNPDLDASLFTKRQSAERSFAASVDGRNLDAYNTIAQHLDFGQKAYQALQNGNVPALNSIANTLGIQTQGLAPANVYRNIATFLGNETARATIGGTNGEGDRQALSKMFSDAASPAMAAANYNAAATLIGGRVAASRRRFQSSVATYDTDKGQMVEDPTEFDSKLTPAARAFEKMGQTPAAGGGGPVSVASDADYAKLASGTLFVGPDGKTRRKP